MQTGSLIGELKEDFEEKLEAAVAKQKNESDAEIRKQKIENEARIEEVEAEIAKQEDKTAGMLSTIFSNIIGVVSQAATTNDARTQELEEKILTNLEEKINKQKIENEALLQEDQQPEERECGSFTRI